MNYKKYRRFKTYLESVLGRTFADEEYDNIAETIRVALEQSVMMGYRYDKAKINNPGYAEELFNLWITNQNDTQHLLDVMEIVANQNPNPGPQPTPAVGHRRLTECDNPVSPYFSVEWPLMGTYGYQGGDWSSEIYEYPRTLKHNFQAESVIMIMDGIVLLENYGPNKKGAIWYDGQIRHLVPGSLCLECHRHGNRWYVTWGDWWNPSRPGGCVWSTDKVNWGDGGRMAGSDMGFGMCSQGNQLCTFGSAYLDWGFDQSYPVLYRGSSRADALPNRRGDGAWAAINFKGRIFGGICGHAAVWEPGRGIVLEMSGFASIHSFLELDGMLLALVNRDSDKYDKGAVIMQSPTGDPGTWAPRGTPFDGPMLFHGQGRRVVGGRFSQETTRGFGRVYELI